MILNRRLAGAAVALCFGSCAGEAAAGLDHKVTFDDSGIWNRNVQKAVEYGSIAVALGGAVWEGGETRLGRTFWQGVDSSVLGALIAEPAKRVFDRARRRKPMIRTSGSRARAITASRAARSRC